MKELPVRKNIRLKNYDYSNAGYYFITMCVKDRHEILGTVIVGTTAPGRPSSVGHPSHSAVPAACPFVELSPIGQCVAETIQNANRKNVKIDKYVIMPNHIHMIVVLGDGPALQQVVRNIKSFVTKWAGFPLWQPRYYDHIIRDEPVGARIARPSLSGIGEVVEMAIGNIPNIYKSISIDKCHHAQPYPFGFDCCE